MFKVEIEVNRVGHGDKERGAGENGRVSHTATDRGAAEEIARRELHRQGVPAEQVEFALQNFQHYTSVDVAEGLHAPAFTPESGAHDITVRIFES